MPLATPEETISKGCSRASLGPCIRMPMRSELGATLKAFSRRLCRDSLVNKGHWGPVMKRRGADVVIVAAHGGDSGTSSYGPELPVENAAGLLAKGGRLVWMSPFPGRTRAVAEAHGMIVREVRDVDMGGFAADVGQLPRIVTLNDVEIAAGKDGNLTMDVTASTFRYLDDEEVTTEAH